MILKRRQIGLFACLAAFAATSQAATIARFDFNEPVGTPMVDDPGDGVDATVTDSENGYAWAPHDSSDVQLQTVVTDGAGLLDVSGLSTTSRRDGSIELDAEDTITTDQNQIASLEVVLAPWSFNTANDGPQELRFGFGNTSTTNVFARFQLQREGADNIQVEGEALGTGGETGTAVDLFDDVQDEPVTLTLEIDRVVGEFSLLYQVGAGPTLPVPGNTGLALGVDRDGNFLRLAFDDFDAETFAIDSYIYSAVTVPEPSSVIAAAIAIAFVAAPSVRYKVMASSVGR